MTRVVVSSFDKFKEAILYVAQECESDSTFAAVKLNKILYFADFRAHRDLGRPITGVAYQHLREGPAPRPLLPAKRELIDEGRVTEETKPIGSYIQKRVIAKSAADLTLFTPGEIDIIKDVIQELWGKSAKEVTDMSHDEWGWRLTEDGDTIPYRTAWFSPQPLSQEQMDAARLLAESKVYA